MYSPEITLLIVNTYKYHVRRLQSKLLVFNCNGNVRLECLMLIIQSLQFALLSTTGLY